jgi:RimJ/RimL family protein N-acetyltransferase
VKYGIGAGDMTDQDTNALTGVCARLRELHAADLDVLRAWWTEPALAVLSGTIVRPGPDDPSVEMFRPWGVESKSAAGLGIESLTTGELVGQVTIQGVGPGEVPSLAVVVGPWYLGQGYEIDALRLGAGYGFRSMGLNQVEITVWALEDESLASYHELGFSEVRRDRDVVLHDGAWHDQVVMRLAGAVRPNSPR